jgi:opacity protein-like surface antigen
MKKVLLILFCVLFAAPVYALTGISFGVRGGLVAGYDQPGLEIPGYDTDQMTLGGLHVRVSTLPMFDLIVAGEYAWKNEKYSGFGEEFELKRHDLLFAASAVYPIKFSVVSPYLGGGLGTHSLGYDYVEPPGWSLADYGIDVPDNTTKMGYHLMAGADVKVPAFPLFFNAEYRINWISTPDDVTKYHSIIAGLNFSLP